MKVFIAFRFTGENMQKLQSIIGRIKDILQSQGAEVFCSLYCEKHFEENNFSKEDIYDYCLQELLNKDIILFLIKSQHRSRGMEFELEQALKHNKKIVLAIQKDLDFSRFRENAHLLIEYENLENLYKSLQKQKMQF